MHPREVEKIITEDGWVYKETKGSHKHFIHPENPVKSLFRSMLAIQSTKLC